MSALPTVKVKWPGSDVGWATINEADFDAERHELWEEPRVVEAAGELKATVKAAPAKKPGGKK